MIISACVIDKSFANLMAHITSRRMEFADASRAT
jgi:hypothetical protein